MMTEHKLSNNIYLEVESECQRQVEKHGDKSMYHRSTHDAIAPLVEEVGEVAKAECDWWDGRTEDYSQIRKELIHLASSALNMIGHMDNYIEEYLRKK